MRRIKTFIATAFVSLFAVSAFAQVTPAHEEAAELGYWPQPYGFIQLQAGGNTTFTSGSNFMDLVNPTFSLAGGYMMTPAVGARLHFNGYKASSNLNSIADSKYKFNYLNSNIDVLVNLTNIGRKQNFNHPLNLYLVGGLGLCYAWDNDEFTTLASQHQTSIKEDINNAWGKGSSRKNLFSHSIRAGLLLDYNVSKNLSVGVEADINSLSDRFNSKYDNADDWMLTAQLSLTYKFGFKNCDPIQKAPVTTEVDHEAERAAAAAAAAAAAEAAKAKALEAQRKAKAEAEATAKRAKLDEPLNETVFFQIRESDPNNDPVLAKAVEWAKNHPGKEITVTGYADKGTGNAKINKRYSEQRAKKVADALKAKGVPADQIVVKAEGDKVQPYSENDQNRCTIVVGK